MPRRSLKNRIKQIIVYAGDESVVFNLDSKEDFEKPKNERDQILHSLRLKLNNQSLINPNFTNESLKTQIAFQNPVHHHDHTEIINQNMSTPHDVHQFQMKYDINNASHSQIPLDNNELFDFQDEDWGHFYY